MSKSQVKSAKYSAKSAQPTPPKRVVDRVAYLLVATFVLLSTDTSVAQILLDFVQGRPPARSESQAFQESRAARPGRESDRVDWRAFSSFRTYAFQNVDSAQLLGRQIKSLSGFGQNF